MKVRDAATILDDAPTYSPPGDWRQRAACRGLDPNLFVTERGEPTAEAKAVCRSCPSLHECAVAGICDPQLRGVWGGLSERERRQARSTMGRMLVCVECAEPVPLVSRARPGADVLRRRLPQGGKAPLEGRTPRSGHGGGVVTPDERQLLTVDDLATMTGVAGRTIRQRIADHGTIFGVAPVPDCPRLLFSRRQVERALHAEAVSA